MDPKEMKVENRLTSYLFARASKCKIPLSGTFELTPLCNFNCKMCYVKQTAKEVEKAARSMMTEEQWLAIAREAKKAGMLYLLLTGGEPFLWPDFWSLYEKLCEMGFVISINTNGSLIDEDTIERLKAMPPSRVNITLYGAGERSYERLCQKNGMHKRVKKAIEGLQQAGIQVKLNGSLTPENAEDLEACAEYARSRGLIYETNTYMFPPVRRDAEMVGQNERFTPVESACYKMKSYQLQYGEDLYKQYLQNLEKGYVPPPGLDEFCVDPMDGKIRCRAGKAAFWITWDGWMTPCGMMPEPQIELQGRSFQESWKELTEVTEQLVLSGVCTCCPDKNICHSCAAMALAETGSTAGIPRYLCETVLEMKNLAGRELKKING